MQTSSLAPAKQASVTAIPDSAVIDSGSKQIVLVAKGEGRFEPRAVKLGRRGDGYAEVTEGLKQGEEVVTSANFLIDAESNLRAALQSFSQQETQRMIAAIIRWSARNVFLVGLATIFVTLAGIYAVSRVPLDAIPDLSDVQVIVYTEYPGQAPQVVEDQVTYPLTTAMLTVPKSRVVRGFSFFGVSFVYVIFEDGTDLYWARSRVLEYLELGGAAVAGWRDPEPRARCDRRRLGLPICRARHRQVACRAAHLAGLVRSASDWPRPKACPKSPASAASSSNTASWSIRAACRRSAFLSPRSETWSATATWMSAAAPSRSRNGSLPSADAAISRPPPISSRSSSRTTKACRCC